MGSLAFRSVQGGCTGEEFTENLKKDGDSQGSKWYDYESSPKWIEASFKTPVRVKFLQLKSANDCQRRDPYEITIQIGKLEQIAHFSYIIYNSRYEVKDFHVDTLEEIFCLRIRIHRNLGMAQGEVDQYGTQLAQVILYLSKSKLEDYINLVNLYIHNYFSKLLVIV